MKLIELLPHLAELKVFDNTEEGDPQKGQAPSPKLLLHMKWGKIVSSADLSRVPPWAKPILQAAIESSGKSLQASTRPEEARRRNRRGYLRGFAKRRF
jgi:hypothetical protein